MRPGGVGAPPAPRPAAGARRRALAILAGVGVLLAAALVWGVVSLIGLLTPDQSEGDPAAPGPRAGAGAGAPPASGSGPQAVDDHEIPPV